MTNFEGNLSQLYLATDLLTSALEARENPGKPYIPLAFVDPDQWPVVRKMPDIKSYHIKAEEMKVPRSQLGGLALRSEGMKFEFIPPFFLNDRSQPQFSKANITIHKFSDSDRRTPVDDILTIIKQNDNKHRLDRIINRDPYHMASDDDGRYRMHSYDHIQDDPARLLLDVISALTKQYVLQR